MNEPPEYLVVGEIVGVFGTKGEVKLKPETEFPERFRPGTHVWVGPDKRRYAIQGARPHQSHILLKLEGVDSVDGAEALRGLLVFVPVAEAVPLEEGAYYHYQLVGLRVVTSEGEEIGRIAEILVTGSNDVFVVEGERGEVLIPATKEVVRRMAPDEGVVVVQPIDGLLATEDHD